MARIIQPENRDRNVGTILVVSSAVASSAKAIFVKLAYAYRVDPITLLALRMAFAMPFFLGTALWSHRRTDTTRLSRRDQITLLILGCVGYYLASTLDFIGLKYISAGLERLMLFLYPTLVVVLSALLFRRPVRRQETVAMALSYAGILLVFLREAGGGAIFTGGALVFASALAYAVFLVGSGHMIQRLGATRFTALTMIVAGLACIAQFLVTRPLRALALPAAVYILALAMALLSTVVPAFLLSAGIRRIGPRRAALLGFAGPISTILLAWIFLGEPLTAAKIAGTGLVLAGMLQLRAADTN